MIFPYNPNWASLRRNCWTRRSWAAAAFFCAAAIALTVCGGESGRGAAGDIRSQDQVWLASTRHLGCGRSGEPVLWQWKAGQWQASDRKALTDQDQAFRHTVVYIHGNRIDDDEGVSGGLAVYQEIVASHANQNPVRFVIWSWPSTKICGPIKDIRTKAWRSDDEAVLLARFLDEVYKPVPQAAQTSTTDRTPDELNHRDDNPYRFGVVAFSYGARITGGALHLLGGGDLDGITIPHRDRPQFRVALWAAAAHNDWLLPYGRHGKAFPLADKWFITVNHCDESLWRYERLEKCGNPPALGYVGFSGRGQLPDDLQKRWEEWDVSSNVGSTHNYPPYVYSPWIAEQTANCVLWK